MAVGIEGSDDDALVTGEQDEELSRWEQEQIRKGINIPQVRTKQLSFKNWKSKVRFLTYFVEVKNILPKKKKSCPLYRLNVSFLHTFFFLTLKIIL